MARCLFLMGLLGACRVGPEYVAPAPLLPETYRGATSTDDSFADLEWFRVFQDPVLQELVRTALRQNYDLRIAAERVMEARERYAVVNADRYPELNAEARYDNFRNTENGSVAIPPGVDPEQDQHSLLGTVFWELDFWGRFQSASDAARAEILSTEASRQIVIQSLVTDLALAYFDLLELDAELAIARHTLESRETSLRLVELRLEQGVANKVELRQAEGLVLTAAGLIPELERLTEQQENLIRVLLGDNPGPVEREALALYLEREVEIPVGLPADLLERRPDVRRAELDLIAANARIGEARALLYPTIRLTGSGGVASDDLGDLFTSGSRVWTLLPTATLPIFNAGRLRANVRVTESQQRQAALGYLSTLRQAFREVADALVNYQKTREVRDYRERFEFTLSDQSRLSRERYRGGVTSYLEVLDSERDHFDAQLQLARVIRDQLFSTVFLYRALGGGWQGTSEMAAIGVQEVPRVPVDAAE